jgi:ABC-type uncharacterized transport system permease subunit
VKSQGVLNLGQEGMMLMGAVVGFMIAFHTDSVFIGFLGAIAAGILMALLFAVDYDEFLCQSSRDWFSFDYTGCRA